MKSVVTALVRPEERHNYVGALRHFFDAASEWSAADDGMYSGVHIAQEVMRGEVLLWLIFDSDTAEIVGFLTTKEIEYPTRRRLAVVHLAGNEGYLSEKTFENIFDVMESFAKDCFCDGIEFLGRKGWKPFVTKCGYVAKPQVVYFKDF